MLSKFSILINLLLIGLIIIQMPKESVGLTSFGFGNKNNFLGSLTTFEKLIKILTVLGILGHVFFAYKLDTFI